MAMVQTTEDYAVDCAIRSPVKVRGGEPHTVVAALAGLNGDDFPTLG